MNIWKVWYHLKFVILGILSNSRFLYNFCTRMEILIKWLIIMIVYLGSCWDLKKSKKNFYVRNIQKNIYNDKADLSSRLVENYTNILNGSISHRNKIESRAEGTIRSEARIVRPLKKGGKERIWRNFFRRIRVWRLEDYQTDYVYPTLIAFGRFLPFFLVANTWTWGEIYRGNEIRRWDINEAGGYLKFSWYRWEYSQIYTRSHCRCVFQRGRKLGIEISKFHYRGWVFIIETKLNYLLLIFRTSWRLWEILLKIVLKALSNFYQPWPLPLRSSYVIILMRQNHSSKPVLRTSYFIPLLPNLLRIARSNSNFSFYIISYNFP